MAARPASSPCTPGPLPLGDSPRVLALRYSGLRSGEGAQADRDLPLPQIDPAGERGPSTHRGGPGCSRWRAGSEGGGRPGPGGSSRGPEEDAHRNRKRSRTFRTREGSGRQPGSRAPGAPLRVLARTRLGRAGPVSTLVPFKTGQARRPSNIVQNSLSFALSGPGPGARATGRDPLRSQWAQAPWAEQPRGVQPGPPGPLAGQTCTGRSGSPKQRGGKGRSLFSPRCQGPPPGPGTAAGPRQVLALRVGADEDEGPRPPHGAASGL